MDSKYKRLNADAKTFADLQELRIQIGNRAQALFLAGDELGSEGLREYAGSLKRLEDDLSKSMKAELRRIEPTIYQWCKDTPGVGEHLLARLIGDIGHPVIAQPMVWIENPNFDSSKPADAANPKRLLVPNGDPYERTVSQLWAYCGLGDASRKRVKGMTAEEGAALGRPQAKMLCRLIAVSCLKAKTSPYNPIYYRVKEQELAKGTKKGHAHNRALRIMAKEILKDLWTVARADIHAEDLVAA